MNLTPLQGRGGTALFALAILGLVRVVVGTETSPGFVQSQLETAEEIGSDEAIAVAAPLTRRKWWEKAASDRSAQGDRNEINAVSVTASNDWLPDSELMDNSTNGQVLSKNKLPPQGWYRDIPGRPMPIAPKN